MDSKDYSSPHNSGCSRSSSTSGESEILNQDQDDDQQSIRKYGLETKGALLRLHNDMEQEVIRMKVSS